jgi:hypothetical protein
VAVTDDNLRDNYIIKAFVKDPAKTPLVRILGEKVGKET